MWEQEQQLNHDDHQIKMNKVKWEMKIPPPTTNRGTRYRILKLKKNSIYVHFKQIPEFFWLEVGKKGSCQYLLLVCQPLLSIGSYILLFVTKDASSKRVQHSVWSNRASCQKIKHKKYKYKNKHDRLYIPFVLSLKKKTWSINSVSFFLRTKNLSIDR